MALGNARSAKARFATVVLLFSRASVAKGSECGMGAGVGTVLTSFRGCDERAVTEVADGDVGFPPTGSIGWSKPLGGRLCLGLTGAGVIDRGSTFAVLA